MSVLSDDPEVLATMLKKLDVKVESVAELMELMASINDRNPETARQKTARLVGVAVPCAMAAAAALTSGLFFDNLHSGRLNATDVAFLAVAWGACALVSMTALIASFIMLGSRSSLSTPDHPPQRTLAERERGATGITRELEIS